MRKHKILFWLFLLLGSGIILYYDWHLIILFFGVMLLLIAGFHYTKIMQFESEKANNKVDEK